jgi:two-component system phosphate regulon response regulator PhoB
MGNAKHILVVEDEEDILELIRYNLSKAGFRVTGVQTGAEALHKAKSDLPAAVVLDLMLPDMDGIAICKALRDDDTTASVPVIMVTAKGSDPEVVSGLTAGADDYLTKPFSPSVLVARVEALLRRTGDDADADDTLSIHGLHMDLGRHRVTVDGDELHLTPTEFRILHLLASRSGWVFSRGQIMDRVKGDGTVVTERSVDVQVAGLRKKLGASGALVETVRGMGYRFKE